MLSHLLRQLELGADPVTAGNQHRFLVLAGRQGEKPAETANAGQHFRAHGAAYQWPDAIDQGVAGVYVDARIFVSQWLCCHR